MKYVYAYKSSDGSRHEGQMTAASRDEVFAALRAKGIKAIKVVAADGSKANGEIRGIRKRVLAASVVLAALAAGVLVYFLARGTEPDARDAAHEARPLPRQEVVGSRERIEAAKASFENAAEDFLARFAEPGRPFSAPQSDWPAEAEFRSALDLPVTYLESDATERIDVRRIVRWMKDELRLYLRGGGSVDGYVKDLILRQNMEIDQRKDLSRRLNERIEQDERSAYEFWLKANAQLRTRGIYPLQLPDQLLHFSLSADLND